MTTTIHPDTPITGDLTPARIADLIDQAAQLIHADGLEIGDYWTGATLSDYEPGCAVCAAGALAVACGYRRPADVDDLFVGIGSYFDHGNDKPHPVFAAVMTELGFEKPEYLYDWSDTATDREVVDALRDAAEAIRARGAVA